MLPTITEAPHVSPNSAIAEAARARDMMDQQRLELRLTVMQSKARIAELKTILRRFDRFVAPVGRALSSD